MIIDLDEIRAELTGNAIYRARDEKSLQEALKARNKILTGLKHKQQGTVYFIYSNGWASARRWWRRVLNAQEHIMDATLEECISRIQRDHRRPAEVKAAHIKAAKTWFKRYLEG